MQKVCTKIIPTLQNDDQKERHMQVCQDIIERLQIEADSLVCDNTWIYLYVSETNTSFNVLEAEESNAVISQLLK